MKKEDKERLLILSDVSMTLEERFEKMKFKKSEVMVMFNDPEIRDEWIEMCKGSYLLLKLPEVFQKLAQDALETNERTRGGYQKLYFQVVNALKPDIQVNNYYESMSDERINQELQTVNDQIKQLQKEDRENQERKNLLTVDAEIVPDGK